MIPWQRDPGVPTAKRFALIPRAVVLHRMETSDCLDSRLFWAIILWSWCGPEVSPDESVVLKDEDGFLRKDAKGKTIPAKQKDLLELLGLAPTMTASVSRAIDRLESTGSIQFGKTIPGCKNARIMYPVQEPPSRENQLKVASTGNLKVWHFPTFVVSTDNFKHLDEVARTAIEAGLDDASTQYLLALKLVRKQADELAVQVLSRGGIIIEKSKKSLLAKDPPPTSQPTIEETPSPEPKEPKPAGRLEGGVSENGSSKLTPPPDEVRGEVRAYLESIVRPGLTPEIVDEVASHITTKERLEAFKHESRPAVTQHAKTWKYWVKIAERVAADAPRYEAAKANGGNGHSPPEPKSRSELRAEAFAREMQAEVDAEAAKMYDRGVRYREPKTSAAGKEPPPRTMREQMIDTALRKIEAEAKAGG